MGQQSATTNNRIIGINRPKVVFENFPDEVVVVNFDNGNYYSLTGTAAEIWNFLAQGIPTDEITSILAASYGSDSDAIRHALHSFFAELAAEQLIVGSIMLPGTGEEVSHRQTSATAPPSQASAKAFSFPAVQKFSDMQDLLLLDPIHEMDESGWPNLKSKPPAE